MRSWSTWSVLPLLSLLGACGGALTGDAATVGEALDSADSTSSESGVLVASTDSMQVAMSAPEAAAAAMAGARTHYLPATCVTATASGATVTYVLNDCTGPYGLLHVTGTITVNYTVTANGLSASATATGLHVNGATLDFDATGALTIAGTQKTLVVSSNGSGVGGRGNAIAHTGSYTLSWDSASQCGTLDGDWSTTIDKLDWSTSVSNFERCRAQCPAAGGKLVHKRALGTVVTVTFDGSATAQWSMSNGHSGTINLLCQ